MNASPGCAGVPPASSQVDSILQRVALGAVLSLAVVLLSLGLVLYRPTLASAATNTNPDLQVQKE